MCMKLLFVSLCRYTVVIVSHIRILFLLLYHSPFAHVFHIYYKKLFLYITICMLVCFLFSNAFSNVLRVGINETRIGCIQYNIVFERVQITKYFFVIVCAGRFGVKQNKFFWKINFSRKHTSELE